MAACSRITNNFAAVFQANQSRRTIHQCLQVRACQGFRDEGRSKRHIDDANLRLLRDRMEVIRRKESMERCLHMGRDFDQYAGWNGGYAPTTLGQYKHQNKILNQSHTIILELLVTVFGTFGITILSGTLCLCLVSIFVHSNY